MNFPKKPPDSATQERLVPAPPAESQVQCIAQHANLEQNRKGTRYIRVGPTGFLQSDDDAKLKIDEF